MYGKVLCTLFTRSYQAQQTTRKRTLQCRASYSKRVYSSMNNALYRLVQTLCLLFLPSTHAMLRLCFAHFHPPIAAFTRQKTQMIKLRRPTSHCLMTKNPRLKFAYQSCDGWKIFCIASISVMASLNTANIVVPTLVRLYSPLIFQSVSISSR
jgi:hypothetical protein